MPARVLIALDKFKDSLTAPAAVGTIAATLRELRPGWTLDLAPLADGGEGFAGILTRAAGGRIEEHIVTGPRGEPVRAMIGFVLAKAIPAAARTLLGLPENLPADAEVAVVEMAAASGLALLAPLGKPPRSAPANSCVTPPPPARSPSCSAWAAAPPTTSAWAR